ncbi:MAG: protein kinase [Bacteroidetes bacterium]|jgi:serine/threonine protein kinase|nr:protein kinase [Bacteroidota bacterium]
MSEVNAAENLQGLVLESGWKVLERIERPPGSTGAFFSVCYKVEKEGQICFLKAFNFARFLMLTDGSGKPVVDVISDMLDAYKYERDLSRLCAGKHVTKILLVKDAGEQNVTGYPITVVPYLVFDLADGDVRSKLTYTDRLDSAWKLKSLHSVATGLRQLHAANVSHQDLKPSNVLLFKEETKIGDIGRSTCASLNGPHSNLRFAGDMNYAPPEELYAGSDSDWKIRSFAADCYLFGSLLVFYFAGVTMNSLLRKHLADDVSWERYSGNYRDVAPYVVGAFRKALDEFDASLCETDEIKSSLKEMVEYLCHPLPEKRGHPKSIGSPPNQYDFDRVISSLDLLHYKARLHINR